MSRRRKDPLRALTDEERRALSRLSRSSCAPAAQVARATALLAIADGQTYTIAAQRVGRRHGDTVAAWAARFNRDGLAAVVPRHGGGPRVRYADEQRRRILAEAERLPDRERDGTATWSLSTLKAALRRAEDGLATVSTHTIWRTLHEAGLSWQRSRTWCATGLVVRKRRRGGAVVVVVTDPDAAAKKSWSSGPTHSAGNSVLPSGARMRPGRSRPSRIRGQAGGREAGRRGSRTSTCVAARPRSSPCSIPRRVRCGSSRRPTARTRSCTAG